MKATRHLTHIIGIIGIVLTTALHGAETKSAADRIVRFVDFGQRIVWVGDTAPSEVESAELLAILELARNNNKTGVCNGLDKFLETHAVSPWAPSLHSILGKHYYNIGRYTLALSHLETAWNMTKEAKNGKAKQVADFAFAHWTRLLASLGRVETLRQLFKETQGRVYDRGPLSQMVAVTQEASTIMTNRPGDSFKCGTYALSHVGAKMLGTNFISKSLMSIPSPSTGFSMSVLADYSKQFKLDLVPARRIAGTGLIVPSVVHWNQNHYAAITEQSGEFYRVVDPTFGYHRFMTLETINAEASGEFLIPENQVSKDWQVLTETEARQIIGRGYPYLLYNWHDGSCPEPATEGTCPNCPEGSGGAGSGGGPGGCKTCPKGASEPGMPVWRVSEPWINVWIHDEPLGYQPSRGQRISAPIYYKQRDGTLSALYFFCFGVSWNSPLQSFVEFDYDSWPTHLWSWIHYPAGSSDIEFTTAPWSYRGYMNNTLRTVLTNANGQVTGMEVKYPGGIKDIYDFGVTNSQTNVVYAFITSRTDSKGFTTRYMYDADAITNSVVRLTGIVDADGKTNTITYVSTNAYSTNLIASVTDPFGRSATFDYDDNGVLTNVTDVAGLSSRFLYDDNGWPTNLITPYGTNYFTYQLTNLISAYQVRAVYVTEADGGKSLYCYASDLTNVPSSYPSSEVPTNTPIDTLQNTHLDARNSFVWNRQQYSRLSTNFLNTLDLGNLTTNDFAIARQRIWIYPGNHGSVNTLSVQRDPSPEGTTPGLKTWYDYPDKIGNDPELIGTQILPGVIARVLPDGSTWWRWFQRDDWGTVTNMVETYTSGTSIGTRTNIYTYSTNKIDLLSVTGPDGNVHASYGYDTNHNVLAFTNAVGDVTSYTYDANNRVTSITRPTGLTTTNIYNSDGWLDTTIDVEIARTNSYTYTNGLVYTHTDERGLTTTNIWDALQRLTSVTYPDGTYTSNQYTYLDLTATKDRLGNWTYYTYNSIRQRTAITNALGYVTLFTYCDCGAVETITDALTNVTTFTHDLNGRLLRTLYADGNYTTNVYDSLGRVVATGDAGGHWTTTYYNNQGLVSAVSNAFGQVMSTAYDIEDHATNRVDANGVSITMTYDDAGRLLSRTYPDSGVEKFAYSARGVTAYTNQLGYVTTYGYDEVGRKLAETNANSEIVRFSYNAASDMLKLIDGKNQTNMWNYDLYGRATNKVDATGTEIFRYQFDANNRLTNRWSAAKGNTVYAYDAVGNLTTVDYPTSTDLSFAYDAANRMTNMVDAVGTTKFTYTASGQLASEDGPWSSDTVSYIYNTSRQRQTMSVAQPDGSFWTQNYTYDAARRLKTTTSPAGPFLYDYQGAGSLRSRLTQPSGAYIADSYDSVARLTDTRLVNTRGQVLNEHQYGYNAGSQRTNTVRTDGSKVAYTYDGIGQLKTATGREADNTSRLHEQFGYAYDAAGNLNYRTNNALVQAFNVDSLNQLTTNTRSGTLTVAGMSSASATNVTVNSSTATRYGDNTFAKDGFSLADGTNTFTAIAQDAAGNAATNAVTVYLPATNVFQYDANGNLLSDGRRAFTYDDENQLTSVLVTNAWKSEFTYDGKMRRRERKEYVWQSGAWTLMQEVHYIYDGNLVVQERDGSNNPQVSYTRGRDLSGSLEGAGGIGGLLARYDHASKSSAHYHADGNGNVTALVNVLQTIIGKYFYDPFGNTLAMSGPLAEANLYRFSSKEYHIASGTLYYLYRYYEPNLQRWPNRDPLGESGFEALRALRPFIAEKMNANPYSFVKNDGVNKSDPLGLMDSVTLGILGCIRSGKPPAECFCEIIAPGGQEAECEQKLGKCIDAICKGLPNLKNGKLGRLPNSNEWCHCGCEQAFPTATDKDRKDCDKACDKAFPRK